MLPWSSWHFLKLPFIAKSDGSRRRMAQQEAKRVHLDGLNTRAMAAARVKAQNLAIRREHELKRKSAADAQEEAQKAEEWARRKAAQAALRKAKDDFVLSEQKAAQRVRDEVETRKRDKRRRKEEFEREQSRLAAERAALELQQRRDEEEAAARSEEQQKHLAKLKRQEEAMKVGFAHRRLGRYTVQKEHGYTKGWTCDVCLKIRTGTFFYDANDQDPFQTCAKCLMSVIRTINEGVQIDESDINFGDQTSDDDSDAEPDDALESRRRVQIALFAVESLPVNAVAESEMLTNSIVEEAVGSESADFEAETMLNLIILVGRWSYEGPTKKWIDEGKHTMQVPENCTWTDLLAALLELETVVDVQIAGCTVDGAAAIALDAAHPEYALLNYFTGQTQKRVVSEAEFLNLEAAESTGQRYGTLYKYQVINSNSTLTQCGVKNRSEIQLQLPSPEADAQRAAGFQESVHITSTKSMDGAGFYEVTWRDKRGRSHVVWKRYSRFLDLRTALGKKVPPVLDLPFPKKKAKKKSENVVDERKLTLELFMQQLMLGESPVVAPVLWEDVGKILFSFLTGESDL